MLWFILIQTPWFPFKSDISIIIRLVGILPNRITQPLAEHSEYPIERLGTVHHLFSPLLVHMDSFIYN